MFKDHFSGHATQYAQARPAYPNELFAYLATLVDARDIAWDCATGNGQAAVDLSRYFKRVIATDASQAQIDCAVPVKNVEYRIALAENSGLLSHVVDLVTVAQALHWFNFDKFYVEVKRVLKNHGILAVWCYELLKTGNSEFDETIVEFYTSVTGSYWPPERKYIDEHYKTIPFPFDEIKTPGFSIYLNWNIKQLLRYLNTWSAVKRYEQEKGDNPVESWLMPRVQKYFDSLEKPINIQMPLVLRAGRNVL